MVAGYLCHQHSTVALLMTHLIVALGFHEGAFSEEHPAGNQSHEEPVTSVTEHHREEEREGDDGEQR